MADKLLKSITFPDLADRYVIPTDAEDFTYEGENLKEVLDNKANTDGYYQNMSVGDADQLTSTIRANDQTPYIFRTSGGSADIGDREYINGIVGGTVAWNQLYNPTDIISNTISGVTFTVNADGSILANGTATATIRKAVLAISFGVHSLVGHKMLFWGCPSGGSASTYKMSVSYIGEGTRDTGSGAIWSIPDTEYSGPLAINIAEGTVCDNLVFRPQCINLTKLFGSTIADYIYSLETANAGAGVAWFKKLFPKPYYEYNAGELKSVSGLVSHDMTGFNQFDKSTAVVGYQNADGTIDSTQTAYKTSDFMRVIPSTVYYIGITGSARTKFYNANKEPLTNTWDGNVNGSSPQTITTTADTYYVRISMTSVNVDNFVMNISWDNSRNGEYEPYVKHSYPLDSDVVLRGIPKLDANNSLYYDGDVYEADGTVTRKYGIVDLGTLGWGYQASTDRFLVNLRTLKNGIASSAIANMICTKYPTVTNLKTQTAGVDKVIGASPFSDVVVCDSSFNGDIASFKTAMSGVMLVYELDTPTTETADPYNGTQIVDDFGTEEFVISNTVGVPIPVGHNTDYPINLKAKVEMMPNSPDGNGDYIVRQTNGMNEYVPLVIEDALPTIPSTAGSYKLIVTVADGSDPVLSWESEV